jgi:hypothetical protein
VTLVKALLIGGPEHGRTMNITDMPFLVIPKPVEVTLKSWTLEDLSIAHFETVVYHRRPGSTGGYVLYVAEGSEPDARAQALSPDQEFAVLMKRYLRTDPSALNDHIRRAIRTMNVRID